ncbi:MAG: hypothetical protein FJ029_12985 [Actinobacteria bacterium]|nr:hypothetical protein [Actinomycetota bacterium]
MSAFSLWLRVIAAPIPIEPLEHQRSGFLARDAAAALRLDELREAVRVIGRYPWLGVGYGDPPHPDLFAGVSNASLWVAERAGVAAAVLGLATLFGGFWSAARTARDNSLARALTSSLIAIAVAGLLDHHVASFPHLVALVGLLVGLAAGLTPRRPSAL